MTSFATTSEQRSRWLQSALRLPAGIEPFPWQQRLLSTFLKGEMPRALNIPTGLGKTSVMAIWLVARACGARLPRRLVYVVDRRAVVDQATTVAEELRDFVRSDPSLGEALGLSDGEFAISTLRGQFIDNRKWMADPSAPAVLVGTVDMIGSRLLFEGYGSSRKLRPYQAGLLGADTLLVLDEAHLVPPFEALVQSVCRFHTSPLVPPLHLLSLSATRAADGGAAVFELDAEDWSHPGVRKRLGSHKNLTRCDTPPGKKLAEVLAQEAWELTGNGTKAVRCIVFSDSRQTALDAAKALSKLAGKRPIDSLLFVGERRGYERQLLASQLERFGFLGGKPNALVRPVIVFATSAGEVGVDLDAECCVTDLVTWERMVQRFGRVNRRGEGKASLRLVVEESAVKALEKRLGREDALLRPFEALPAMEGGGWDVSPGALVRLKERAAGDDGLRQTLTDATTPEPLYPPLTGALVDAWSMTSLEEHPGRPHVEPWLRGWGPDEEPQTRLLWRAHLPPKAATTRELAEFIDAAPPQTSELLEAPTYRVVAWLQERVAALLERPERPELLALLIGADGRLREGVTLGSLDWRKSPRGRKKEGELLVRRLQGMTLVVDHRYAGLRDGLLDEESAEPPPTLDEPATWLSASSVFPADFRVRRVESDTLPLSRGGEWRVVFQIPEALTASGDVSAWLVVEERASDATSEEGRSSGPAQTLQEHQLWTEEEASRVAERLQFPPEYAQVLRLAARLHDEGKKAARWQRAFHAPSGGPYAKTLGPVDFSVLDGYRHELGSLPYAERDGELSSLAPELRELALHLVASHHGLARPVIPVNGCEDTPPSLVKLRAEEVALRFMRLQRRWGPWGLAWWEALLRASDQRASRRNELERSADAAALEVA